MIRFLVGLYIFCGIATGLFIHLSNPGDGLAGPILAGMIWPLVVYRMVPS